MVHFADCEILRLIKLKINRDEKISKFKFFLETSLLNLHIQRIRKRIDRVFSSERLKSFRTPSKVRIDFEITFRPEFHHFFRRKAMKRKVHLQVYHNRFQLSDFEKRFFYVCSNKILKMTNLIEQNNSADGLSMN